MEMKRCARGHFFDGSKNITCPYCRDGEVDENKTMVLLPEEIEKIGNTTPLWEEDRDIIFEKEDDDQTSQRWEQSSLSKKATEEEWDKTEPINWDDFPDESERKQVDVREGSSYFSGSGWMDWDDPTIPEDLSEIFDREYQNETTGGLEQDRLEEDEPEQGDTKTTGMFGSVKKVVGWLVCVKGADKGKDFVLGSGRNFVGRSPSMDISLKDESVTKERHAAITYDPRGNHFFLSYGTGDGMIYLNGVEVLEPMELKPYDLIEVGNTILSFVPFCGESFKWEETK